MKKLIFVFTLFLFFSANIFSQNTEQTADELVLKAQTLAVEEGQNIFVIYEASWCKWCKKMINIMTTEPVAPIINQYYVLMDLEVMEKDPANNTPGAMEMLENQGGGNGQGLPFWVILDKNAEVMATSTMQNGINAGCPASPEEITYLLSVLQETSGIGPDQLQAIGLAFSNDQ